MQTDYIWDELSKVYNMSDVPDKAKSIIGDLMLKLDESSAQPDHLADVSKKGDLISREDALSCFHDWIDQRGDVHTADEMPEYQRIEQLPTAQPDLSGYSDKLWREAYERGKRDAQADFDMTEKIDKAYDDGYEAGYLQGRHDWGDLDE